MKLDRAKLLSTRMDYVNRKPVTTYKLTDEGKTVFGPMAAEQTANLNARMLGARIESRKRIMKRGVEGHGV